MMGEEYVVTFHDMPLTYRCQVTMALLVAVERNQTAGFLEAVLTDQWQFTWLLKENPTMIELEALITEICSNPAWQQGNS